ncbi:uncharacterized protein [Palaemon carinicauda]|uniref:uncharacterized protein n=1 Tax=Palaemon carinicauda TaxID=392227 RepID=UPI0035B5DE0E
MHWILQLVNLHTNNLSRENLSYFSSYANKLMLTTLLATFIGFTLGISSNDLIQYAKVDSRYAGDFETCFVASYIGKQKPFGCANLCSRHVECRIFCITTDECRLYRATVSRHWNGIPDGPQPTMRCFSSWGNANDAAPNATIAATPALRGSKEFAVNGYSCSQEEGYTYVSDTVVRPWWSADLGTTRKIKSVRVFSRLRHKYSSKFKDVEVRVGYSNPENGNFSGNGLLGYYQGEAPYETAIYFIPERPLKGSVVSIQIVHEMATNLILPDVQILYV